jgi:predicted O-methyltransferase YrrM
VTRRGAIHRLRERLRRARKVARYAVHPWRSASQLFWLKEGQARTQEGWPAGHFYSPIPALDDIRAREREIFAVPREVPGVDLNEQGQLRLLEALAAPYAASPYATGDGTPRYHADNPNFAPGEAAALYAMIHHLQPRRIIEVGSGFSSAVILDATDTTADPVECTMIEPYPELLRSVMRPDDARRVTIVAKRLQEVGTAAFARLGAGDILFIDSTHVSKTDSDVSHALGRILPSLASGVVVHFHDIYYPFEYPREWVYQGRAWNEAYALRAFLQYNTAFRIELFTSWLWHFQREALARSLPPCAEWHASSLWLRRL